MTFVVDMAESFDDSMLAAGQRYTPMKVAQAVLKFVEWKAAGNSGRQPGFFSDDKWSGFRNGQAEFLPYIQNSYRHCHLDLDGTEPLLAYRQFENEEPRRIVLVCITSHDKMFRGNERGWMRLYHRKSSKGLRIR